MLKAITHSKAGRVSSDNEKQSERWKDIYQQREDLMTAAVFSRFAYLSEELQNQILSTWFGIDACKNSFCGFEEIVFWPNYLHPDSDVHRVEPDVLLIFDHCYLLVEVKPPQGGDQYQQQWHREITAFLYDAVNKDQTAETKPLNFLAIGRIDQKNANQWFDTLRNEFKTKLNHCAALRWQPATDHLYKLEQAGLVKLKTDKRVLADIFEALALYGLHTKVFQWSELSQVVRSKTMPILSLNQPSLIKNKAHKTKKYQVEAVDRSLESLCHFINSQSPLNLQGMSSWTITK
jgi:hypothetical protein